MIGRRRPAERPPVLDQGLQAERTMIAWQRTALGLGAIGALIVHSASRHPLGWYLGGIGLLVSLGLLVTAERRYVETVRLVAAGRSPVSPRAIRLLAAATMGLTGAALLSVVPYL